MATTVTVDSIVHNFANILARDQKFNSLCHAALLRLGRSVFINKLARGLSVLASSIDAEATLPLTKATAWMLNGCRTAVALRICELVIPETRALELLVTSTLDQVPIDYHRYEQLESFVAEQGVSNSLIQPLVFVDGSDDEEYLLISSIDDKLGYDPPDLALFADFDDVKPILCTGPAVIKAHKQLADLLFTSPLISIKKALAQVVRPGGKLMSMICVVDWECLHYFKDEKLKPGDIDSIFTVTGTLDVACTARLADYVGQIWPKGKLLLDAIISAVVQPSRNSEKSNTPSSTIIKNGVSIQILPATSTSKEQAYLKISGTFDELRQQLEQIAWLTATLRSRIGGQLTISDVDVRSEKLPSTGSTDFTYGVSYVHISLVSPDKVLPVDAEQQGHCWTSTFTESVLAYGFSLPDHNRPEQALGLEIPFEIMATFTGVQYPVSLGDRIAFASETALLTAEAAVGDSIQWHFQRSQNWLEKTLQTKKNNGIRSMTLDLSALVAAPAFLGYYRKSGVVLGTAEYWNVEATESGLPRVESNATPGIDDTFKMNIDENGYGTAKNGNVWRFNRGETALVHISDSDVDKRVWHAARKSALLYDVESSMAFLVSELSLVLQLVLTHLRKHSQMRRAAIPVAEISADGGQAAYEAISKGKNSIVLFEKGHSQRYIDVMETFLNAVEQRRTQNILHYQDNCSQRSPGLRGWDYADLQARRYEIWERKLDLSPSSTPPIWWEVFKNSAALVVFTRSIKSPIRSIPTRDNTFDCHAWDDTFPHGKHLLLANMVQLERFRYDARQNPRRYPTWFMLSDEIAWIQPVNSTPFHEKCRPGGSCNPIQSIVEVSSFNEKPEKERKKYHRPANIESEGAVLFADDPSEFDARRCITTSLPKAQGKTERNYIFIGVSLVIAILGYWNFKFFAFCSLLCGIAYVVS